MLAYLFFSVRLKYYIW